MKLYKRIIKEKWIKSGNSRFNRKLKIFINPTRKELELEYRDVRGFVASNGKVYIGSDGIHPDIADIVGNELNVNTSVPFVIEDRTKKDTKIEFGDMIYGTQYKNDYEGAEKVLKNNKWIKKMFPQANITGDLY